MSSLRWVSWAAVSSLPQAKKISIDDQLQINREHCARHGGQLVAELVVPGESRSIVLFEDAARRIDAYARFKELIDQRAFDVLVYLDASRLGRIGALVMAVRALCQQAGVILYETDNPPATLSAGSSYDDDLVSAIKAVGAEREVRKTTARHASGMLGRAKAGDHPSRPPWGYVVHYQPDGAKLKQTYVIDESAAATVRRVFALYLSGRGSEAIALQFAAEGLPTATGGPWTRNGVRSILRRAWRYAGYVELNVLSRARAKRPYYRGRGNWPAIIDESTLQRFLTERQVRKDNRKVADARHILTGLCVCGTCGHGMIIHRLTNQGRQYDYIRCGQHKPALYVRSDVIIAALRALLTSLPGMDLDHMLTTDAGNGAVIAAQLQAQAKAMAQLAKAKNRADTAYVDGNLDPADYTAQVHRLRAQQAQIEAESERLEAQVVSAAQRDSRRLRVADLAAAGIVRLDSADTTATNMWLRERLRLTVHANKDISIDFI